LSYSKDPQSSTSRVTQITTIAKINASIVHYLGWLSGWWQLKYLKKNTPILVEMIQSDEHIFQMGWFNHQLDEITPSLKLFFGT